MFREQDWFGPVLRTTELRCFKQKAKKKKIGNKTGLGSSNGNQGCSLMRQQTTSNSKSEPIVTCIYGSLSVTV